MLFKNSVSAVKEIFDPKMKMFWNRDPQIIQDVNETVSSMEQILRNLALQNLPSNRSSAVNGCHQNESLNSWEKHYNNPQLIQTIPVHQLTSWEVESWVFVMKKYIIMMFKLFKLQTVATYIIAFTAEK